MTDMTDMTDIQTQTQTYSLSYRRAALGLGIRFLVGHRGGHHESESSVSELVLVNFK